MKTVLRACWFNTTAAPGRCLFLILQNRMFSLPQLASRSESVGENFNASILKSLNYRAQYFASTWFDPAARVNGQITISSRLCFSFPTTARNLASCESAIVLTAIMLAAVSDTKVFPCLQSLTMIRGGLPCYAVATMLPLTATQTIGPL